MSLVIVTHRKDFVSKYSLLIHSLTATRWMLRREPAPDNWQQMSVADGISNQVVQCNSRGDERFGSKHNTQNRANLSVSEETAKVAYVE